MRARCVVASVRQRHHEHECTSATCFLHESVHACGCFNVRVSLQWDGCLGEWTYQQEAENAESGSDWEDSDSDSDEDEDARRKRKNLKSKHARRAKKSRWNPLNVFRNMRRTVVID